MATQLIYLENFDVLSCSAQVVETRANEDGRVDITLDQTCFYPRGGGQDWDRGTITSIDGLTEVAVDEVRLDENGLVHHIGKYQKGELKTGETVSGAVD